ncbi:DUF11 domain-containing protein [Cryocola sp. 340MFSha3.1]|uniref:DUF7507 domain-containing protein n=1 Tax=Cryocola sp. 340MFSha3.1 TaxID=1169145 RepID=UPI0003610BE2|nr:DUF11 domain-containing protein [Cryocola sp. 340MFSha3.1]
MSTRTTWIHNGRPRRSRRGGSRPLWPARRAVTLALTPLLLLSGLGLATVATAPPAAAASNAQLLVAAVAVDPATGTPLTTTGPGQFGNKIAFRVDFSCIVEDCANAVVRFDPTQLDPNQSFYRLLVQSGFTPPLTGGTLTGSATTGYSVALGTLPAGSSGSLTLEYTLATVGALSLGPERSDHPVSNFPDGFPIVQGVHGTADGAVVSGSASAPVTWRIGTPDPWVVYGNLFDPQGREVAQGGVLATDTDYRLPVQLASNCVSSTVSGNSTVTLRRDLLCASAFTVTQRLPPGAEFVAADGNPQVSGSVASGLLLTWQGPAWAATGNTSQIGWGAQIAQGNSNATHPRFVTMRFPRENLAPPGRTCDFDATVNGLTASATVTYISMPGTPGTVKTANRGPGAGYVVRCTDPFPRAIMDPKTSTFDGATRTVAGESNVLVPASGENLKEWRVTVANTANIPGVAVVTDDALDLAGLPVYQIVAPVGSTIVWTATDGTTTVSGTSTGTADAPAGFRFAASTVTSPVLTAPNRLREETRRTDFSVVYRYRVTPDAPWGARRTDTASAVMQWPANPEFAPTTLGPVSHTVVLVGPFARLNTYKRVYTDIGVTVESDLPIPGTGTRGGWWNVYVGNSGNAPAIPRVTDTTMDDPNMPVTRVRPIFQDPAGNFTDVVSTIRYTLDDGTTGTVNATSYTAPAGRHIVAVTATGPPLPGGSTTPQQNQSWFYIVTLNFTISADAIPETRHTNTAQTSLDYQRDGVTNPSGEATRTAHLVGPNPVVSATMGVPQIPGGATSATTTSNVTFTVGGGTSDVSRTRDMTPQYVFVAPAQWNIAPRSASFPAGSVPAGVTFAYRTVTIAGVSRQAVVASWPDGTVFGKNRSLPTMSVIARPSASAPAGSVGVPNAFVGNSAAVLPGDVFNRSFTDVPDLDGDGSTSERFSQADNTGRGVPVAAVAAMQVLKEICLPSTTAPGGCQWFADPNNHVGVPPNSTSIRYRVTVTNTGNTALSNVTGYDILPYPGDTGTSDPTGSIPRGSTMRESISTVSNVSGGPTLSYSDATQPCRLEVDASVPGCVDDWDSTPTGAQAIRLSVPGTLAPGAGVSLQYTATVLGNPGDGAVGCNSIAVRATGLANVSEPAPVCASIEETDLRIVAGTPRLQLGRPGVLPWTVTNLGGAASTQAAVTVALPEGLSVTSFAFGGWTCTATDAGGTPVFGTAVGPATLSCTAATSLLLGQPRALDVPVVPTRSSITVGAEVTGRLYDGHLANNHDDMRVTAAPAAGAVGVTKDDGRTTAAPGDLLTYTVTARNPLLFETLTGAVLTDVLPGGVQFVSASGGGSLSGTTVTWNLPALPGDGTVTRTLTVRVLPTIASARLDNTAWISVPDPANPAITLDGDATDSDAVRTTPAIVLEKGSISNTFATVGETVQYTFRIRNTGDVTLSGVAIADSLPGLSAVSYVWPSQLGVLAPGQAATGFATVVVTQADLDAGRIHNTATVTSTTPGGTPVTDSDEHTVTSTAAPAIALDKTASGTVSAAGDLVEYRFTITNSGPLTLTDVEVRDPMPGLSDIRYQWPGAVGILVPGQVVIGTATYAATLADVNAGSILNSATANGHSLTGVDATAADGETITVVRTPGIALEKSAHYRPGQRGEAGDTVVFDLVATNTGNTTLTDVVIADPLPGLSDLDYTWPGAKGVLLPGQSVSATARYVVTQTDVDGAGSVTNAATVTGSAPDGSSPTAAATTTIATPADSAIQLVKTGMTNPFQPLRAGDAITYRFEATNTGVVTLSGVTIADGMPGLSTLTFEWPGADGTLAPGQTVTASATYVLTQADIDRATVVNTATTSGTTPDDASVTDDDTATTIIPSDAHLAFDKTAAIDAGTWTVGDTVTYGFSLRNTGTVTLTGVRVRDDLPGLSTIDYSWPGAPGVLAPGDAVTGAATYRLTAHDLQSRRLTNVATASSDETTGTQDAVTLDAPADPGDPPVPPATGPGAGSEAGPGSGPAAEGPVVPAAGSPLAATGAAGDGGASFIGGMLILCGLALLVIRRRRRAAGPTE